MLVKLKDRDCLHYSSAFSLVTVRLAGLRTALSIQLLLPLTEPRLETLLWRTDACDNRLSLTTNKVVQIDQTLSQLAALSEGVIARAF